MILCGHPSRPDGPAHGTQTSFLRTCPNPTAQWVPRPRRLCPFALALTRRTPLRLSSPVTTAAAPSGLHWLALVRPLPPHLAAGCCRTDHPFIRSPIASHPPGLNRLVPHCASTKWAPRAATSTGEEDDGGGFDEVGGPSLDLSPPPLDLRDVAVARVPASSGVLFLPSSGELEGDGLGVVLHVFLPCCNEIFGSLQQMFLRCCSTTA
jgi:hypothetical protein